MNYMQSYTCEQTQHYSSSASYHGLPILILDIPTSVGQKAGYA